MSRPTSWNSVSIPGLGSAFPEPTGSGSGDVPVEAQEFTFVTAFVFAGPPPYLALAAGLPLSMIIGVTAVAGFAAGALNPIISTVKLERVPPGLRARVYGVIGAAAWAAMPLGSLVAGYATDTFGLTWTLLVASAAYLLAALMPLRGGPWRLMSAKTSREPPSLHAAEARR